MCLEQIWAVSIDACAKKLKNHKCKKSLSEAEKEKRLRKKYEEK